MSYGKSYPHIPATLAACAIVGLAGIAAPAAHPTPTHESADWRKDAGFVGRFRACGLEVIRRGGNTAVTASHTITEIKHDCAECPRSQAVAEGGGNGRDKCQEFDALGDWAAWRRGPG